MKNPNETRNTLITEAAKLFLSIGYDATSVNDLVKRCGVSKGAFYHHFKSKDDLFLQIVQEMFAQVEGWIRCHALTSTTFREFLDSYQNYPQFFRTWSLEMDINANMIQLVMDGIRRFPKLRKTLLQNYETMIKLIADMIKQAQESGEIR